MTSVEKCPCLLMGPLLSHFCVVNALTNWLPCPVIKHNQLRTFYRWITRSLHNRLPCPMYLIVALYVLNKWMSGTTFNESIQVSYGWRTFLGTRRWGANKVPSVSGVIRLRLALATAWSRWRMDLRRQKFSFGRRWIRSWSVCSFFSSLCISRQHSKIQCKVLCLTQYTCIWNNKVHLYLNNTIHNTQVLYLKQYSAPLFEQYHAPVFEQYITPVFEQYTRHVLYLKQYNTCIWTIQYTCIWNNTIGKSCIWNNTIHL